MYFFTLLTIISNYPIPRLRFKITCRVKVPIVYSTVFFLNKISMNMKITKCYNC